MIGATIERRCSVIGMTFGVNRIRDSVNDTIPSTTCMSEHAMHTRRSITGRSHGVMHTRNTHNNTKFPHIHSSHHDIGMMVNTIGMTEPTTQISHRVTLFIHLMIHVGRPVMPRRTLNIPSGTVHTRICRTAILTSRTKETEMNEAWLSSAPRDPNYICAIGIR